jgi:hypothetical protein
MVRVADIALKVLSQMFTEQDDEAIGVSLRDSFRNAITIRLLFWKAPLV